ncbi:MAG: recombinase family protein, partial [Pirellulaceae bacterium]|nr:recombinase family protein [Pirellulaceae bacterium]
MPKIQIDPPFNPRNAHTLRVIGIERISTDRQDAASLEDQKALLETFVRDRYDVAVEFVHIATRGSGEWLDRDELIELREFVTTRNFDLVVAEDLGRIMRDLEALMICGHCIDHGTRLIAINDYLDTARPDWEDSAIFAAWRHKKYNHDTANRIKQRLANRFDNGGTLPLPVAGYIKKPGAKTDDALVKDPTATPIIQEVAQRLLRGASFSEIADWLNEIGFDTGLYCRNDHWDCRMVGRWIRNPLLHGERQRNNRHTQKHYGTGRRRSVPAPPEMIRRRKCPHLAHLSPEVHLRLLRYLDRRNSKYRRSDSRDRDPLLDRPKKRTIWPG